MREKTVKDYAKKIALQRGWLVRKLRWEGRSHAPDNFYAKDGRIVLCEHKRSKVDTARRAQDREHKTLRSFGVEVVIINTKEQVDAFF